MKPLRPVPLFGLVALITLLFVGCGDSSSPTTPDGGSTAADAVTIDSFSFVPSSLTVPVGTTVMWTNDQGASHTVTADDGSFDSGKLATGDTFSHTFDTAGTVSYHCTIHPNMIATITVEG